MWARAEFTNRFEWKDVDILLPSVTPKKYLWPSPAGSGTRLNHNAGRITAGYWIGDSITTHCGPGVVDDKA